MTLPDMGLLTYRRRRRSSCGRGRWNRSGRQWTTLNLPVSRLAVAGPDRAAPPLCDSSSSATAIGLPRLIKLVVKAATSFSGDAANRSALALRPLNQCLRALENQHVESQPVGSRDPLVQSSQLIVVEGAREVRRSRAAAGNRSSELTIAAFSTGKPPKRSGFRWKRPGSEPSRTRTRSASEVSFSRRRRRSASTSSYSGRTSVMTSDRTSLHRGEQRELARPLTGGLGERLHRAD